MTRLSGLLLVAFAFTTTPRLAHADDTAVAPEPREVVPPTAPVKDAMPLSKLAPAKPMFDACVYRYAVSTTSPQCQAFVNQGLGMYYSYVWIEAVRSFETALRHDPECAYAWLMLHRSMEKWGGAGGGTVTAGPFQAAVGGLVHTRLPERAGKAPRDYALEMARKLMPKANHREQLIIQARLQEKGMWPNTPPEERRTRAQQALDELLMLYEDDTEGWFWRAQLASGPQFQVPGGPVSPPQGTGAAAAAVFYKALLRVDPLHPGANHELVHLFEAIRRPALGWPYAEGYIKSSPGMPHALHMQAHLAMRIGKWGPTTDWSAAAVELEKEYHKYQGVLPREDHQFSHHMETLTRSLVHDGRFAEAKAVRAEAEGYKYAFRPEWFRMALAQKDWDAAQKVIDDVRSKGGRDKTTAAYYSALLALEKGDTGRAAAEIDTLRQLAQTRKSDKALEQRLWEVQGRHLCQTGQGEAGLKLLKKAVDATKNDYFHHAWGNGAVLMEAWGVGALEAGAAAAAEEAFQEALAHDAGSVRGALGMWALCDRLGRTEEADRYLKVARRCWAKADPRDFDRLKADLAAKATRLTKAVAATEEDEPR
jgi:Tfp pilus assembly protein PilF